MKNIKLIFLNLNILIFCGCAQFEKIDRSIINKPALSLNKNRPAQAPTGLTQQRSGSKNSVGGCTVCAH